MCYFSYYLQDNILHNSITLGFPCYCRYSTNTHTHTHSWLCYIQYTHTHTQCISGVYVSVCHINTSFIRTCANGCWKYLQQEPERNGYRVDRGVWKGDASNTKCLGRGEGGGGEREQRPPKRFGVLLSLFLIWICVCQNVNKHGRAERRTDRRTDYGIDIYFAFYFFNNVYTNT